MSQTQIKQSVAARLKQAREQAGFRSQEEFCKQFNLPLSTYKQHEQGQRAIRATAAMRYCRMLHVSMTWLLLGEAYPLSSKHPILHAQY